MADGVKPPPQQIFPAIRPSTSLPVSSYIPSPPQCPWVVTLRPETEGQLRKPDIFQAIGEGVSLVISCAELDSDSLSIRQRTLEERS